MSKTYILDTNILLHDANSIFQFQDNTVVIPLVVIEELDAFKKDHSEIGRNARQVSRDIDKLRASGSLLGAGVALPNGGQLKIQLTAQRWIEQLRCKLSIEPEDIRVDHKILAIALECKEKDTSDPCTIISKDINLRILADSLELSADDYKAGQIQVDDLYTGIQCEYVTSKAINLLYSASTELVPLAEFDFNNTQFYPNQFIQLHAIDNVAQSAIARVTQLNSEMYLKRCVLDTVDWGLKARNLEQKIAMNLLRDSSIELITIVGKAGTGKTLLALAAGLEQTVEEQNYLKVLVSRPIFPLGKDLGFLPGDLHEKLDPWMQPIYDNLEYLASIAQEFGKSTKNSKAKMVNELFDFGYIEVEALTYIRGRSIPAQYLIVDEAQNLTPHEVKTIITRAGKGTKIVLTGDPHQIDNPYVDSQSNGLSYVVDKFKTSSLAGHIRLRVGERSALAEEAAKRL